GAVEALGSQPAVVAIEVVGPDERIARIGRGLVAQRLVRASRPIQPRRPIVRARKIRGRLLEDAYRIGMAPRLVGPPPDPPFGEPEIDELAIVALRRVSESFECRPRLCVPLAAEETLRPPELELVPRCPRRDRLNVRQALQLGSGKRRQVAQRKLVVDARKG